MRNKFIMSVAALFIAGFLLTAATTQKAKAQDVMVSYQTFYDNLAPYGQWIYDPQYGNVWVPNEDGNFRPYGSRGRWVMTDYGNTWISDDPWGWAVYHYGRWTYNPYYGWIWIPGYEWAPAWVTWRFGGGYAGWAPLGPGVAVGVSYYAPESWWVFVGPQYMYEPNCIRYWHGPTYNPTYIRQTTIINNYYIDNRTRVRYNYGPRAEVVQQVTRRPVQVYNISHLNRPGAPSIGRGSVSVYRPQVNRSSVRDARPNRVMQAPQPVGRGQAVQQYGNDRQPAFRQDVQRQNTGRGNTGSMNGRSQMDSRSNMQQRDGGTIQRGRTDMRTNERTQQDSRMQPGRTENRNDYRQPERTNSTIPDNRNTNTRSGVRTEPANRMQPQRYDSRMDRSNQQSSQPARPATRTNVPASQPQRQQSTRQTTPSQPQRQQSQQPSQPQRSNSRGGR